MIKSAGKRHPIETATIMSQVSAEASNGPVQALINAVATSKLRLVRLLIEGGVHVDSRNDHGQTPLLITCSSSNNTCHSREETRDRVVKYLISAGADVNAYDDTGRTPLIYAVIVRASVIFDLIDAGADPWWEDRSRKCAFDYAIQLRDLVQVELIVGAYKRKIRVITRDVGNSHDAGNGCDVGDTRDTSPSREQIQDTSRGKQNKKSTKKLKMSPKNRKRLSRNISIPNMITGNKNGRNVSIENPKRSSLPQVTSANPDKNIETLSKSPPVVTPPITCGTQESTSNLFSNPTPSSNVLQIHDNTQLCDLCKTIFTTQHGNEGKNFDQTEKLNFTEYDFSGLLYRRRSTGSLFGLTEKRYETIRKKRELGITMEDLFSSTDINQPGKHPLFVKSPRTNTLVDISASELLVPDRARSVSVSLPPLDETRLHVGMLCSRDGFGKDHFLRTSTSVPQLHTMAWSHGLFPESRVYPSSDDDCDDIIIFPASYSSMMSSPILDMTSSSDGSPRDMSSHYREMRSPSPGESEPRNSPIPTIVLTDYVNRDKM